MALFDPVLGDDLAATLDLAEFGRVGEGRDQVRALAVPLGFVLGAHGQQPVAQLAAQRVLEAAQHGHHALQQPPERQRLRPLDFLHHSLRLLLEKKRQQRIDQPRRVSHKPDFQDIQFLKKKYFTRCGVWSFLFGVATAPSLLSSAPPEEGGGPFKRKGERREAQ